MRKNSLIYDADSELYLVIVDGKTIGSISLSRCCRRTNSYSISAAQKEYYDSDRPLSYLQEGFPSVYAAKTAILKWYDDRIAEKSDYFSFLEKDSYDQKHCDVKYLPQSESSEFYPTPSSLVGRMLRGINWREVSTILEPEAGKGDIVKGIKKAQRKYCNPEKLDIDCIEKDTYLQHILRGEGYRVVHDDFLTFNSKKQYDLIIMNPPFSNADEHLLKAIEVQTNGGGIICVLNAETLRNPCTKRRQYLLQKLTETNAKVEYLQHEFKKAERKTETEIALVKIYIPRNVGESKIYERLHKNEKILQEEKPIVEDLAPSDIIEFLVRQYNLEVEASLELIREYNAMRPYMMNSFDESSICRKPILTLTVGTDSNVLQICNVNKYLKAVRRKYWCALLTKEEFIGRLTSNLQDKYRDMIDELADYDFTVYNIERIRVEMNAEMTNGIKTSILNVFDKMSQEHSFYPECHKNIHYYSGWKTNKAHKVGKKVILPINGMFSTYSWEPTFKTSRVCEVLADIEKVFNYLSGDMNADCRLYSVMELASKQGITKNIECKYFTVTLYKKGTAHIVFKDEQLVEALNIFVAQHKNWLPPCYSQKQYNEMTDEERKVVDDFQGESNYTKVLADKDKFLFSIPERLLLGEVL